MTMEYPLHRLLFLCKALALVVMKDRITHIDTIRGGAIMGILVMNMVSFGLGNLGYYNLNIGSYISLDWVLGFLGEVFADQKFMGLFSLLFGASLLLFLDRVKDRSSYPVTLCLWRNFLLLCFGVIHAAFWIGDVLSLYALCCPFLLLFRYFSARILIVLGVLIFLLSGMLDAMIGIFAEESAITTFLSSNGPEEMGEDWIGLAFIMNAFSRALGLMCIGMGLFRNGWLTERVEREEVKKTLVLILLCSLVSGSGIWWTLANGYQANAMVLGNIPNTLITIPMALGYARLLMWWDQHGTNFLISKLRFVGRMALSNYLGQTAICMSVLSFFSTEVTRSRLWLFIIFVWIFQLWFSEVWLRYFRMGPLEWIWRNATYRRIEPFRKK